MFARDVMKKRKKGGITDRQQNRQIDRKQDKQKKHLGGQVGGWMNGRKGRHVISNDKLSQLTQ